MLLAAAVLAIELSGLPEDAPAPPQDAQEETEKPPTPPHTGIKALFGNFVEDLRHLPAKENAYIVVIGGGLAIAVHPADQSFNARLRSHYEAVNTGFAPGKYLGDTPEQLVLSLGTYAVGRLFDMPKTSHMGMDLLQAQMLSVLLVQPIKFATSRARPDQSNSQSFPSGHAAATFAAATVIERHLGWKKSVLAYAIASYVAASRLHDNRHYASDVVFGAALGAVAGRTVVHHAADYWTLVPAAGPDGGGAILLVRSW